MTKNWNAYIDAEITLEATGSGLLSDKSFAIKDVFAIQGVTSSAGNPDWLSTHSSSEKHAEVLTTLLQSGANLQGTTITDELMYSINGENFHYGTPNNPNALGRIPGGSSSGSAVAVAAGLVDFAIGTDTGGSVRVPSSYSGIYGIRPTHASISTEGLIPLAPSFDTVGWMARDADTLLLVGKVLLANKINNLPSNNLMKPFTKIIIATDMWELTDEHTKDMLNRALPSINKMITNIKRLPIAEERLEQWMNTFRQLQGAEIWQAHGEWITVTNPTFGPGIAERFAWASTIDPTNLTDATTMRQQIMATMNLMLDEDTLIIAPVTPSIAPFVNEQGEQVERRRNQTLQLSCVSGLAGLPQVSIPLKGEAGLPIGLSVIAGKHQDIRLLQWVSQLSKLFLADLQ
ncbi:amidase [Paenibacillus endoradicis]|uniref:amidase n=1 Tax=Paenibacillus endoradicis TaxID=2972487 RepID=UPI0021598F47|nr:amidase [Paenibacillus endoradicis]MCR8657822.1 amidase [Paenibacillus endoradicis]